MTEFSVAERYLAHQGKSQENRMTINQLNDTNVDSNPYYRAVRPPEVMYTA